jgi:hypothetical protein
MADEQLPAPLEYAEQRHASSESSSASAVLLRSTVIAKKKLRVER